MKQKPKKLWMQVFSPFLILIVVTVCLFIFYSTQTFSNFHNNQVRLDLLARAKILQVHAQDLIQHNQNLGEFCKDFQNLDMRITLIHKNGQVVCDSKIDASTMESHANRPEFLEALNHFYGTSTRYSNTLKTKLMYVAIPITNQSDIILRTSVALTAIESSLADITLQYLLAGIAMIILAALFSFILSKKISHPIEEIKTMAHKIASGQFNHSFPKFNNEEFHSLIEAMHTMTQKLQAFESMRSDFVANVSHELKTPLTSIKGFAETLIDDDTIVKSERIRFLRIISKQTDRLSEMINDLLNLSKIEQLQGEGKLIFNSHNLKDIAQSALEICATKWSDYNPQLENDIPPIFFPMNHSLIEQAFINLIDNAIKYGGNSCYITYEQTSDAHIVRVQDNGPGIEAVHLERLFERFYRVDKSRSRDLGGTGLGLSIVKHIMETHNGQIDVESKVGEGTTFILTFNK